jgi:hypothetical protein
VRRRKPDEETLGEIYEPSKPYEIANAPIASPMETADYAAEMAAQLATMCERAGLLGLSTLFFAANSEAVRAKARLLQRRSGK